MLFNDPCEAHEYLRFIPLKTFLHCRLWIVPSSSRSTFLSSYDWMFTMWILSCHFLEHLRRIEKWLLRNMILLKFPRRMTKTVTGRTTFRLTRRVGYTSN